MPVEKPFNGCKYGGTVTWVSGVMWHTELDRFMYLVEYDDNDVEELGVEGLLAI
jgi:hypothetical protein